MAERYSPDLEARQRAASAARETGPDPGAWRQARAMQRQHWEGPSVKPAPVPEGARALAANIGGMSEDDLEALSQIAIDVGLDVTDLLVAADEHGWSGRDLLQRLPQFRKHDTSMEWPKPDSHWDQGPDLPERVTPWRTPSGYGGELPGGVVMLTADHTRRNRALSDRGEPYVGSWHVPTSDAFKAREGAGSMRIDAENYAAPRLPALQRAELLDYQEARDAAAWEKATEIDRARQAKKEAAEREILLLMRGE
tara:strand:- start:1572 stop:2330 length:759 start_codon:yes stop_codon:yes gene_type:complete